MLIEYKNHKIFAFSDTQGLNNRLEIPEEADILICAGNCSKDGFYVDREYKNFLYWFSHQKANLRLFVPGDYDFLFNCNPEAAIEITPSSITVLENSGVEYDGISFYSVVCRNWIFRQEINNIPYDVDILITHAPAKGHLDNGEGDDKLLEFIEESKPKIHLFGHALEQGGKKEITDFTTYYNVSIYNQIVYRYTSNRENKELVYWVVKGIEEDIINSYMLDIDGSQSCQCLLSLRKKLINEIVLSHQEDYIDAIKEFNGSLRNALREMSDRANRIYTDLSKHKEYGDEIKIKASLYLSKQYPSIHPIHNYDRQNLWDVLLDEQWNEGYENGITTYSLSQGNCANPFELFSGADTSSNQIEGFNKELTKELQLVDQFHHLYRHTEFAITDFIYVRDFYSEIKVSITKENQNYG
jgi:hypothetical protein